MQNMVQMRLWQLMSEQWQLWKESSLLKKTRSKTCLMKHPCSWTSICWQGAAWEVTWCSASGHSRLSTRALHQVQLHPQPPRQLSVWSRLCLRSRKSLVPPEHTKGLLIQSSAAMASSTCRLSEAWPVRQSHQRTCHRDVVHLLFRSVGCTVAKCQAGKRKKLVQWQISSGKPR